MIHHTTKFLSILFFFIIPLAANAQNIDELNEELKKRVEIEVRGTHILLAQLLQSEIGGNFERLGNVSFEKVHGEDRWVARSMIDTKKTLSVLKVDFKKAIDRLSNNDLTSVEKKGQWKEANGGNGIFTYWILRDNKSKAKIHLEVFYATVSKKIIISTYAFNFKSKYD